MSNAAVLGLPAVDSDFSEDSMEETSIRGTLGFGSTMLRMCVWTPFSL